ncbi:DUF1244 domain-containing protein [Pseudoxanthobacter sp.]|uniref:DUF1244 domain-containing protein n=1 Tax=Pseudoxanthobacter sp. TaxID=1925742 RepID=UPI002FE0C3A1
MDEGLRTALEAAAFRRLVAHLRAHPEVQNIDLMNLAGFCRNCLSNWYQEAAAGHGVDLDKAGAREIVYGMPYDAWKARFQREADAGQAAAFAARMAEKNAAG